MLRRMHRRMSNENGFTLIEVIVSLVLIGIVGAIAGMGLVQISQGYVFAKQNAEAVQKAQIAIARMVKELGAATTISTATANSVAYTRPGPVNNTLTIAGGLVQITGGTPGILIDKVVVASSSFTYYDAAGTTPVAVPANIRRIAITLTVSGADNQPIIFDKNDVFIREF